jgi:multiple sugar transport system permease protein
VTTIKLAEARVAPAPRTQRPARSGLQPYVWLVPAFALLAFVVGYPILQNVVASFTTASGGTDTFVGFDQYSALLADPVFYRAVVLTVVWTVGVTVLQFALGAAAALVADRSTWFVRRARSILIIPWVLPGVVVANIWVVFYNDRGLVNTLLSAVGLPTQQAWLADGRTAMLAVIIAAAWKGFPFYFLLLLAGLQSVPVETRESAKIDGAGPFQTLVRVVVPQMRAIITTSLVLGVIATSNYFDGIYLMTAGGPSGATLTLPVWVYNTAFADFDFARASALSVVILLIVLVPVVARLLIGSRRVRP